MAFTDDSLPAASSSTDDRLDSWKEIATFLKRDVRTVQRWEKQAGLPVHRHSGGRLRAAYAFRSELDAWWRAQDAAGGELDPPLPMEPSIGRDQAVGSAASPPPRLTGGFIERASAVLSRKASSHGRKALATLAVLGAILAGVAGLALRRPVFEGQPTSVDAGAGLAVLVASIEDEEGDRHIARALHEAVSRQLTNDGRLRLVSPERVQLALGLMRRDGATPLSAPIAREVALREGHARYVVTGRTHRLDARYLADLQAVEPGDGSIRASLEWHARSPEDLVSDAALHVRRLAELIAHAAARPATPVLEPVTTASLPALRLFSEAVHAGRRRQWGASESLVHRALVADPEFPAALAWLALTMRQQGRPVREILPSLERAVRLADAVTDRESHLIRGTWHTIAGSLPAAISELEALLRLHPEDRHGLDLLVEVYSRSGRTNRAIDLAVTRAERYPDDFHAVVGAAQALTLGARDPGRAAGFARRARELATPDTARADPDAHAWLAGLPVFHAWMEGAPRALADLQLLDQGLVARLGRDRDTAAAVVGFAYMALDRVADANRAFRFGASPERQLNLATLALNQGQEEQARRWLLQVRQHSHLRPALFARAGLDRDAERGLESAVPSTHAEGVAAVVRGLIDARAGRHESASLALRQGVDLLRWSGQPEYFLAIEELSRLAKARRDLERAVAVLEMAAAARAHTYGIPQWTGGYWIRLLRELATLHEAAGREEDAARVRLEISRARCANSP